MSSNIEDVNSSGQETGGASAGQRAGQAVNSAKKAGQAAKNIQKQVSNARKNAIIAKLIGFLWPVALIIILIILLIGVATAIRSIPGMMMDKILETGKEFWTGFKSYFEGNQAYISDEAQNSLAEYIENMGYDVVGYGFATPEQVKGNENIKSKYLLSYLLADYNTYAIDSGIKNVISGIWGKIFKQEVPGLTGMIYFDSPIDKLRYRS